MSPQSCSRVCTGRVGRELSQDGGVLMTRPARAKMGTNWQDQTSNFILDCLTGP